MSVYPGFGAEIYGGWLRGQQRLRAQKQLAFENDLQLREQAMRERSLADHEANTAEDNSRAREQMGLERQRLEDTRHREESKAAAEMIGDAWDHAEAMAKGEMIKAKADQALKTSQARAAAQLQGIERQRQAIFSYEQPGPDGRYSREMESILSRLDEQEMMLGKGLEMDEVEHRQLSNDITEAAVRSDKTAAGEGGAGGGGKAKDHRKTLADLAAANGATHLARIQSLQTRLKDIEQQKKNANNAWKPEQDPEYRQQYAVIAGQLREAQGGLEASRAAVETAMRFGPAKEGQKLDEAGIDAIVAHVKEQAPPGTSDEQIAAKAQEIAQSLGWTF